MTENVTQLANLLFFKGYEKLHMKFPVHYKQSIATATAVILFIIITCGVHLSYKGYSRNLLTEAEQYT